MGEGRGPYVGVGEAWPDLPLGQLIRAARAERSGLGARRSQGHVAEALGVSEATIGAVERGDRVPGLELLSGLVTLLEPDEDARAELLTRWLVKWVQLKVEGVGGEEADRAL